MRKKVRQKKKRGLFNSWLVKLSAAAVLIGCAVLIITTESDYASKQRELDILEEKIEMYQAENGNLKSVLESDDMSDYMEKVALEERGYAYPDERRFYDTSRD